MDEMTHTPRFNCAKGCCSIFMQEGFNPYSDPRVGLMGIEHFRPRALVITAPELLEALVAIMPHFLEPMGGGVSLDWNRDDARGWYLQAEATIAKARGQS